MSKTPSLIDTPRRKFNKVQRRQLIPSLRIAGLTQEQIAEQLNVSRSTIINDMNDMEPAEQQAIEQQQSLIQHITQILPIGKRAEKYAELATSAKNEAVSLGALQRIDDLDGIVTEKERLRAKRDERPAIQALFMLAPGAQIDFGGSAVQDRNNTICSDSLPDNGAVEVKPNGINGGTSL